MKREYKFRVWEPLTQRFYYFSLNDCIGFTRTMEILKDSVIQEYTTAQDKDGKEIYEGDILNYRGRMGKVEYFAAMYICSWNDQTDDELSHMIIGDIEVIGNVFENPELLNSIPPAVEEDEEENEDLSSCESCGERGWDGRICHICGAKHI